MNVENALYTGNKDNHEARIKTLEEGISSIMLTIREQFSELDKLEADAVKGK